MFDSIQMTHKMKHHFTCDSSTGEDEGRKNKIEKEFERHHLHI